MDADLDRRELLAAAVAGMPLLLGRPPAASAALRDPLALVTADQEAHVAVVSLARRRVVARIATLAGPRSIQSAPGDRAIVGHSDAGAVSLLDARDARVRRVLRGFAMPRYTAVHPNGRLAFVSDGGHGEIAVVDLVAGRVRRRVPVGDGARHLALDAAGRRLWVALGSSAAALAVVDISEPLRPRVTRRVHPPFLAHDVGFSPDGRRVWVTAGREGRIAVYAARGSHPLRGLAADRAPQHVAFGPGVAYVASGNRASVRVHRLADGALLHHARVPLGSFNIKRAGARVLTPSLGTGELTILGRTGAVVASIRVANAAHDACAV